MTDLWVAYDPAKEPGDRLAPEVVDEIQIIAQAGVDSVVGSADLEDGAVTTPKIADLASRRLSWRATRSQRPRSPGTPSQATNSDPVQSHRPKSARALSQATT